MTGPDLVAEPSKWLGETIGFWIQTIMLAVSAVAGIWIILSRGKQEGRRATVDLIVHQTSDAELKEARKIIKGMHEKDETNLARYLQDTNSAEYKAILKCINTYEFVASGIRTNAFSEVVYKRLRCFLLIKDWEALEGFVAEFRKLRGHATFFQDFEWLYRRWKKNPLKEDD